ncbi:MAG: sugar ABC transporter ATP-binding protein [bacterium]|nr:sugar ABC transporter ATP-binding protein [bacterium]
MDMQTGENILELQHITKTFPGVKALTDVSCEFRYGEVHALAGENGAGKSTLMKILAGVYHPTSGEIVYQGQSTAFKNPYHAQSEGISIIFQEFSLIRNFDVVDNVFLNREPTRKFGHLNKAEAKRRTLKLLNDLDIELDVDKKIYELSVVQQQVVEIVKALSVDANVLIMDEPSATLTDKELRKLFEIINMLREKRVCVIYISHRMEELFEIADRVSVLKDGQYMGTREIEKTTEEELIGLMVGRKLEDYFPEFGARQDSVLLNVRNLNKEGRLHDINFSLYPGEVLGISGMGGSGRTLLIQCLLGVVEKDSGETFINGEKQEISSIRDAIRCGFGYIPEDRKTLGIFLSMLSSLSVKDNMNLSNLDEYLERGLINKKKELTRTQEQVRQLKIKISTVNQLIGELSGGNQQKVIIARWLLKSPNIYIFDEPTRGIDVGAKAEIYKIMRELTEEGNAVIMISSELPEVLGMSDRILVLREGRIGAILDQHEERATEEKIMSIIVGHAYTLHGEHEGGEA